MVWLVLRSHSIIPMLILFRLNFWENLKSQGFCTVQASFRKWHVTRKRLEHISLEHLSQGGLRIKPYWHLAPPVSNTKQKSSRNGFSKGHWNSFVFLTILCYCSQSHCKNHIKIWAFFSSAPISSVHCLPYLAWQHPSTSSGRSCVALAIHLEKRQGFPNNRLQGTHSGNAHLLSHSQV